MRKDCPFATARIIRIAARQVNRLRREFAVHKILKTLLQFDELRRALVESVRIVRNTEFADVFAVLCNAGDCIIVRFDVGFAVHISIDLKIKSTTVIRVTGEEVSCLLVPKHDTVITVSRAI